MNENTLIILQIILPLTTSIIAIIISIVAIFQQTKSQEINACIQLYDKRFEIFMHVLDIWYIVGFFEGCIDKNKMSHTYDSILKLNSTTKFASNIQDKIISSYEKCYKFKIMHRSLFSGKISKYLEKLLNSFYHYISGIYNKEINSTEVQKQSYRILFQLKDSKDTGIEEINNYLMLSHIKMSKVRIKP